MTSPEILAEALGWVVAAQGGMLPLGQGMGPMVDGPPAPPALPAAPFWEVWLLEEGFRTAAVLAVLAAAGAFTLRAVGRSKDGARVLAVGLVLAAGAWVTSKLIETGRETIGASSRALVHAAARADTAELDRLLADDLNLFAGRSYDKDGVLALTRDRLGGPWKLKSWSVLELQASTDAPTRGQTQVKVRVVPEATGFPDISWWKLDWRLDPQGWRVIGIEPVSVNEWVSRDIR